MRTKPTVENGPLTARTSFSLSSPMYHKLCRYNTCKSRDTQGLQGHIPINCSSVVLVVHSLDFSLFSLLLLFCRIIYLVIYQYRKSDQCRNTLVCIVFNLMYGFGIHFFFLEIPLLIYFDFSFSCARVFSLTVLYVGMKEIMPCFAPCICFDNKSLMLYCANILPLVPVFVTMKIA